MGPPSPTPPPVSRKKGAKGDLKIVVVYPDPNRIRADFDVAALQTVPRPLALIF